jgi:superfamily II DNA helicase RecQ
MAYRVFQYALPGACDLGDLNGFLASQRVVEVRQHLVSGVQGATLVFVVQTDGGGSGAEVRPGVKKVDWRAELSGDDFAVFCRLRDERKRMAEAEGVPVYTLFSNEQLADLARRRPATLGAMGETGGVGTARLEKYGARLLPILAALPASP